MSGIVLLGKKSPGCKLGNTRAIFSPGAGETTVPKGIPKEPKRITRNGRGQCTVCQPPARVRIEALRSGGQTLDKLANQFGLHRDAVWRHMKGHVSAETVAAYLVGPAKVARLVEIAAEDSGSVIDYLRLTRSILVSQLDRLASKHDHHGVTAITGRLLDTLRELGKITGEVTDLAARTTVNVQVNQTILSSQPFTELQAGLLRVCAAHPQARQDIVRLIRDLDAKYAAPPPMIEGQAMREAVNA